MAIQLINIGDQANDGTGDPLRTAFGKINNNFAQLSNTSAAAPPDGAIQYRGTNSLKTVGQLNGTYAMFGYPDRFFTSADGISWDESILPANAPNVIYNQVFVANNTLVAVGANGTIVTTTSVLDPTAWQNRTNSTVTTSNLSAVSYGANTFVAVGDGGTAITSADGATWAAVSVGTISNLKSVVYGDPSIGFTVVGENGVISNSTAGATWTTPTTISSQNLRSISFTVTNGANFNYVAVGDNGTVLFNNVATPTWTAANTANTGITSLNLYDVTSATVNGNLVYVAAGANSKLITSTDANANTWSNITANILATNFTDVLYSNAAWLAIGSNGAILRSIDAVTWSNNSLPGVITGSSNLLYDSVNNVILTNATILPQSNTINIGSVAAPFKDLYVSGNSLHVGNITESQTSANTLTFSLDSNVSNLANIVAGGITGQTVTAVNAVVTGNTTTANLTVTGNTSVGNLVTGPNIQIGNVLVQESPALNLNLLSAFSPAQRASLTALTVTSTSAIIDNLNANNSLIGNATANTLSATRVSTNVLDVFIAINAGNANLSANVITANVGNIANINSNNIVANSLTVNGGTIANGNITANNFIANSEVIANGNITSNGFFVGNGYFLTGTSRASGPTNSIQYAIPDGTGNFTFSSEAAFTYNPANNTLGIDNITSTGNANLANTTVTTLMASGNVTANNFQSAGNITVNNVVANTNITSSGTIGAAGNIQGANLVANASLFTDSLRHANGVAWQAQDFAGAYSNANVANYLPNYTGNISAATLTAATVVATSATITSVTGNLVGNVAGNLVGNTTGRHTGAVVGDVTGNVTGNVVGNVQGDVLGNLTGNVFGNIVGETATITTITGNVVGRLTGNSQGIHTGPVTGNVVGSISGGNVSGGTGTFTGAVTSASLGVTANITAGNISATGNISASLLTGTLTTAAQPNITSVGNLVQANIDSDLYVSNLTNTGTLTVRDNGTVGGNLTVAGNLTVTGNTNYVNTNTLVVQDPIIEEGGGPNGAPLTTNDGKDRGLLQHYYTTFPVDAFMGFKNSTGQFFMANDVSVANNVVTVNTYGNLVLNTLIGNVNGNLNGNTVTTSGNANIGGNLNVTGVISGNGSSLVGLPVQTLTAGANITLTNNAGNWTINAALAVSAAGNVGELQFADANGNLAASNALVFASNVLTVPSVTANLTGNVTGNLTGNVTGNIGGTTGTFSGDVVANNITTTTVTGNVVGNVTGNITGNVGVFDQDIRANNANITNDVRSSNANIANTLRANVTIGNNITVNTRANLANIIIANTTVYANGDTLFLTGTGQVALSGNNSTGSDTIISGGNASDTGVANGGLVTITGGTSSINGFKSGNVVIKGGNVDIAGIIAGEIQLQGGRGNAANGGQVSILGGNAVGSSTYGGNIKIAAGNGLTGNGKLILNRLTFPDLGGNSGEVLALDSSNNIVYRTVASYAAGSNTYVQFNDAGNTGGSSAFTFDKSVNTLSIANAIFIGNSTANATVLNLNASTSTTTANQSIATWSNAAWRSAVLQIDSDDGAGNIQYMKLNATRAGNGLAVTYTMTDARKGGSNWVANYAMDYSSGNFRLLTTPFLNTSVTHNINVEYLN